MNPADPMPEGTLDTSVLPENAYSRIPPGEHYRPIVPAGIAMPEATLRSVGWGLALCVVFTLASAYSGLKVGQVMEASIPISIRPSVTRAAYGAQPRGAGTATTRASAAPPRPWWLARCSRCRRSTS